MTILSMAGRWAGALCFAVAIDAAALSAQRPHTASTGAEPPDAAGVLHVRLVRGSDLAMRARAECGETGSEVVAGKLRRAGGGRYAGTLTRRTDLLECNPHHAGHCSVRIVDSTVVRATGIIADSGAVLWLAWRADSSSPRPRVTGDCDPAFAHRLALMHRGARCAGLRFRCSTRGGRR